VTEVAHDLLGGGSLAAVLEPLKVRNTAEQIADRLVTAIALGEFVPEQRLPPERELAATLGVSRASVREALHRLAATGYVVISRGRNGGATVQASWGPASAERVKRTLVPNWDAFEALFDLRSLLEALIAHTAATRRSDEDVRSIQGAVDDYTNAGSDREASRAADGAVHAAVARATGNPYLMAMSREIRAQVSLGFGAEPYSPAIRARAIEQHGELARAIAEQRADEAAAIAREHFLLTESALRELRSKVEEATAS
jgi:DNA-binding FadR family transcriptional regulator